MLENYVHWIEESGEWHLVSYASISPPHFRFRLARSHRRCISVDIDALFCVSSEMCGVHLQQPEKRDTCPREEVTECEAPGPVPLPAPVIFLYNGFNWTLLSCFPVAFCGGFSKCVSDLPWGNPAPVSQETGETRNFEKWQNWSVCYRNRNRNRDRDMLILFSDTMMLDALLYILYNDSKGHSILFNSILFFQLDSPQLPQLCSFYVNTYSIYAQICTCNTITVRTTIDYL